MITGPHFKIRGAPFLQLWFLSKCFFLVLSVSGSWAVPLVSSLLVLFILSFVLFCFNCGKMYDIKFTILTIFNLPLVL